MSVYTDGTHLVADTVEELHQFAQHIGLRRQWFQDHLYAHYDMFGSMPKRAIAAGAIQVTIREIVHRRIGRQHPTLAEKGGAR